MGGEIRPFCMAPSFHDVVLKPSCVGRRWFPVVPRGALVPSEAIAMAIVENGPLEAFFTLYPKTADKG